jgi:hypothetical protein
VTPSSPVRPISRSAAAAVARIVTQSSIVTRDAKDKADDVRAVLKL